MSGVKPIRQPLNLLRDPALGRLHRMRGEHLARAAELEQLARRHRECAKHLERDIQLRGTKILQRWGERLVFIWTA